MTTTPTTMVRRLVMTAFAFAIVSTSTACSALGAICAGWIATPCLICFNENSSAAIEQSLEAAPELPMTLSVSTSTSTSMSY